MAGLGPTIHACLAKNFSCSLVVLTSQSLYWLKTPPGCWLWRAKRVNGMAEAKSGTRKPRKARERRRDKEVRPQQIVAAAFEEFAEKGFAGARLEDVASRAKVSKGLPYLYFKTKVELFKAVIRSVITSHFEVIREEMETTDLLSLIHI